MGRTKYRDLFVTGTDTAVGKTTVACGIAATLSRRGLKVGVCKPAETGCQPNADGQLEPQDALRLKFFSSCGADVATICPYQLRQPLAPAVAAQHDGISIRIEEILRCRDAIATAHDVTLVEGAGGLLVPLTPTLTFADLAARLDAAVVVIVASRLGAINHALLTLRYARQVGIHVLGYIVNFMNAEPDLAARTNVDVLTTWLGPPLGIVPYLGKVEATETDRQRLAETFAECLRLDELLFALQRG